VVIVAEGIERAEQHRTLAEMGCDLGQGFLWSKALPAAAAAAWATGSAALPPLD
jgi:EAL domain-containing protein (putative c-di-GMP-specific phosphodiesterase class I)